MALVVFRVSCISNEIKYSDQQTESAVISETYETQIWRESTNESSNFA